VLQVIWYCELLLGLLLSQVPISTRLVSPLVYLLSLDAFSFFLLNDIMFMCAPGYLLLLPAAGLARVVCLGLAPDHNFVTMVA
jgi:hypothetical protein